MKEIRYKKETKAIRETAGPESRSHSVPLYLTSSFQFNDAEQARAMFADEISGNIYSRFSNPNTDEFIRKMCLLEGAEDGIATASGMSAVFTSIAGLLQQGDHMIVSRAVFGSTHQLITQVLPKFGISYTYVDGTNLNEWDAARRPDTKMVFIETPSNPGLELIDLEWMGKFSAVNNLILNVDNCFATPYIQQPVGFGAHLVTHSATKFIDGQGRGIGGVIVGKADLIKEVRFFARHTGPAMSPFNAWMFSKSLETLAIRVEKHAQNAMKLALFLQSHACVSDVKYPHLPSFGQYDLAIKQMKLGGGIVTFKIKGNSDSVSGFLNSIKMCSLSANLGDTRTIVTHPASTTHSKLTPEDRLKAGITDTLIRVSVGLEHPDDIIFDIKNALESGL